jgi:hypothetical protein
VRFSCAASGSFNGGIRSNAGNGVPHGIVRTGKKETVRMISASTLTRKVGPRSDVIAIFELLRRRHQRQL